MNQLFPLDEYRFFTRTAALTFKGEDAVDTVKELEEAIDDLDDALSQKSSSGYEKKIMQNLISNSEADTYDNAKTEWSLYKRWTEFNGTCELCGHHPILYHFQIKNKINHNTMILGSHCILNYVRIEGFTEKELSTYLNRLRGRLKDLRFDAIDKGTFDTWDKSDEVFANLKKLISQLPRDFTVSRFHRRLHRFDYVRGYRMKPPFASYIKNVGVMSRVMKNTYHTTEIREIPDKIQRKQKIYRRKVSDQKRLELFIEFETQLKLLMKYGTPTDAYDLIMEDFKEHLRKLLDTVDAKKDRLVADITAYFADKKRNLGSRSKLKDYVDSWRDMFAKKATEAWATYEAALGDADGLMSGHFRLPYEPSADPKNYITDSSYSWPPNTTGELNLFKLLMNDYPYRYSGRSGNLHGVSADSPLLKVDAIDPSTLKGAFLDSLDKGEIPVVSIKDILPRNTSYGYGKRSAPMVIDVSPMFIYRHPKFLERLVGTSADIKKAIKDWEIQQKDLAEAEKKRLEEEAAKKAVEEAAAAKELQEYADLVKDAEEYTDPNNDWEKRFVADMKHKFKKKSDLNPKQLYHLNRIGQRSQVPDSTPAQSAAQQQNQAPAGAKSVDFKDFIEDCKTTMYKGRESGFVNSILRRYSSWSSLSPRQQKWVKDIYTRKGRAFPDHVT